MRYLCLNCEARFEHEDGQGKLRCPKCMRVTGLEKIAEPTAPAAQRSPWVVPAIAAVVLVGIGIAYAAWRQQAPAQVSGDAAIEPLALDTLRAHLRRLDVDGRPMTELLEASDAVESFASEATEGRREALAIAEGVQEAIRARAEARAFVPWSFGVPRETPPGTAATALEWLGEDGGQRHLYPLEIAAIMTSALRTRGVNAMVAELFELPGTRTPPDGSGVFGYFGVAVYEGEAGEGTPRLFDPYGGREQLPDGEDDFRVLTDVEAVGAALSLRAYHLFVRESDIERAMSTSQGAIRLYPRSPTARCVRAAILARAGGPNDAADELRAATEIRMDPPRRVLLANARMQEGDVAAAASEIEAALEEAPDYALGHAMRAMMLAASEDEADSERALTELREAERLDPDLHILPMMWAGYYATQGDFDSAVTHARRAVERSGGSVETRMAAARIYRYAARYTDMRREARAILDMTPDAHRAAMEEQIRQILGALALEEDDSLEDEDEGSGSDEALTDEELDEDLGSDDGSLELDPGFQLGGSGASSGGGLQLGGGRDGPSLLDEEEGGGGGSRLRLGGGGGGGGLGGGGGGGLRLDL